MKEQAIQKINKIGKISSVIALIGKILVGIGIVIAIIGAIICLVLPEDLVEVNVATDLEVEADFSTLGVTMTDTQIDEAQTRVDRELMEEPDESLTDILFSAGSVTMKGGLEQYVFNMRDFAGFIMLGLAALIMTFVTLVFIGGLCKAFRDCQSPFEENVIRRMQYLAYSLVPWALVSTVTNTISETLANNKMSIMFSIDLGVILVVLVVLVLVYIFKYGAVLQQESDETL